MGFTMKPQGRKENQPFFLGGGGGSEVPSRNGPSSAQLGGLAALLAPGPCLGSGSTAAAVDGRAGATDAWVWVKMKAPGDRRF